MNPFRFMAASGDETIVYGSQRPGYPERSVGEAPVTRWIRFMKDRGISRVCCLLSKEELDYYRGDLLRTYRQAFGGGNLCWAPVEDFHLSDPRNLIEKILPFLADSARRGMPVVVHCAGGRGRTGHVLAAWLVHRRGGGVEPALSDVVAMGRNPFEAIEEGAATPEQLRELLGACAPAGGSDAPETPEGANP